MKPFKAYTVSDDEGSVVRYAQHAVVARRDGACELDEDFGYVTCRRAPEFDHFYPHGPSDLQKFENGWWFECSFCGSGRACVEGGMYSDGRFFCEGCVEGFTDMRPVETPRYVSQFFGGDYVLKECSTGLK